MLKHRARRLAARTLLASIFCVGVNLSVRGDETPLSQRAPGSPPRIVEGVDCSRLAELGIDVQTNMRAGLIRIGCGVEAPGVEEPGRPGPVSSVLEPLASYTNVDVITGGETLPHVTQSESFVYSNDGNTIVVNYNDSRAAPSSYAGISYSLDGGVTFTRILPSPLATGHGVNYGDPIVVYNANLATWYAGDLAGGCGGQGIGLWTSPDAQNWNAGACAHSNNNDDRESMWVDNNPGSPNYGRMYISWNNFSFANGSIFVTHSDDGINWSPVQLNPSGPFHRNVQVTGGPDGTVFVAAMNEGGGGLNPRQNLIYISGDGGATWNEITMGAPFAAAGEAVCSNNAYFSRINPIWRYMGWGQPAVGPGGTVHYVYTAGGPGDAGNIYYTQSADNGMTWSAPIMLNSDGGTASQWMPSLSSTASGQLMAYWYDRRNTSDGMNYEVYARRSPDNGATWLPDEVISDALIPQPQQPDPNVQPCYAGDYNYATAFGATHFATWTDGRNLVGGIFQQDVYFAAVPAATSQAFSLSADPASLAIPQGGSDVSTVTVSSTGGFSDAVVLACNGLPDGVTCGLSDNPVTPPPNDSVTSTLTITVDPAEPVGGYDFNITGTNGGTTQTAAFHLDVSAAGTATAVRRTRARP